MVFPSLPVYHLDPPNWSQQQPNQQPGGVIPIQNPQIILPPPPQQSQPPPVAAGGGGGGATRPGSMADRARLAKVAHPEAALKCPRCESTNTKFCYYNNYSLSQPRHFCKTCRRYWTRGGALRNVPVGGGCRRKNKRSKGGSNTSKSPTKAASSNAGGSIVSNNSSSSCCPSDHHHLIAHLPSSQLLFSHNYSSYDVVSGGINNINAEFQFQTGSSSMLSNGFTSSLQHQQFPFLAHLEAPIGMYHQFERSENIVPETEPSRSNPLLYSGGSGIVGTDHHQLSTTVKSKENVQVLGMSKSPLGNSGNNNEQFWDANSGNAWNIDNHIPSFTHLM